jgi:hypothetical protein
VGLLETNPIAGFKESFISQDGLKNLCYNLDFSILQKYRCFANCKSCYIKNDWIPQSQLSAFVPKGFPTGIHLERLLNVFEFFEVISVIDDLRFIKDEHPHLFDFYKSYGKLFHLGSMNDNAVIRQHQILKNEFHPQAINEICFSEDFLSRIKLPELLCILEDINKSSPIMKIKILSGPIGIKSNPVKELINWSTKQSILVLEDKVYKEDIETWSPKENSQVVFLMNDVFYPDLKSAIKLNAGNPFGLLAEFDPKKFLFQVLNNKIKQYQSFATSQNGNVPNYYSYLAGNLIVNENFNFLPLPALGPFTKYYRSLLDKGLATETKYGLLLGTIGAVDKIVPLFEFKK